MFILHRYARRILGAFDSHLPSELRWNILKEVQECLMLRNIILTLNLIRCIHGNRTTHSGKDHCSVSSSCAAARFSDSQMPLWRWKAWTVLEIFFDWIDQVTSHGIWRTMIYICAWLTVRVVRQVLAIRRDIHWASEVSKKSTGPDRARWSCKGWGGMF